MDLYSCDIYQLSSLLRGLSSVSVSVSVESQRAVTKSGNIPDCKAEEGFLPAIVCVSTIFRQYISYHLFLCCVII